jgi:hypothetical protein
MEIRKLTGHRSEELDRYKHFSPAFQQQTTGLIDRKLSREITRRLGTKLRTPAQIEKGHSEE